MYNPGMYQQAAAPPANAVYQKHMMPSTSSFPADMQVHMNSQQPSMPNTSSNPDMSGHAADAFVDTNDQDDEEGAGKRRRVQRACDTCRKKKVRCDGLQPEKGACSNCANYGYECTFVDAARKRAPPRSYVEAIEARIVKMEQLVSSLAPGVDFTDRIGKPIRRPDEKGDEGNSDFNQPSQAASVKAEHPLSAISVERANSFCASGTSISQMLSPSHAKVRSNTDSLNEQSSEDDSEDDIAFIESRFGDVNLKTLPTETSSSATFDSSRSERLILNGSAKADPASEATGTHKFIGKASAMHSLPILERLSSKSCIELGIHPKGARPEYWAVPAGFIDPPGDPAVAVTAWPAADLADKLINAYFGRMNREFPVVNESQFRDEYMNHPELRQDSEWLGLAFCIFMVGSHYLVDDRVRAFSSDPHSRGMHWWQAAKGLMYRNTQVVKPLYHIQCLLLSTLFQLGLPLAASASWLHLGGAIRLLLDVGAHRKQAAKKLGLSRIEEETYKRTFWVAYSLDRELASSLGRPIMLQDEDIDVELPIEIDDEYLFNTPEGQPLPKQPGGKPALIGGFLCSLRLDEIVGRTLKTVYALHKTKLRFGINSREWDERLVTEIDSALNNWLDTVPPHLRYDPHETDDEWLMQSSLLYSKYYNCQLLVHRPFIPAKKGSNQNSILNFPSLAICTNAARSISHLIQNLKDRELHNAVGIPVAFRSISASSILLLVVWGAKRNGGRVSSSASTDLRRSIDVLRSMEAHWQFCGKAVDILESVMTSTHVTVPRNSSFNEQGTKRSRDGEEVQDGQLEEETSSALSSARNGKKSDASTGKIGTKANGKIAHGGSVDGQPLAPEARQLPLSTQQLASMTPRSSAEQSPSSANNDSNTMPFAESDAQATFFGDPFDPKTPQAAPRARMPSLGGASGIPASLSFGLMTPSAANWGSMAQNYYMQEPHSQAHASQTLPAITPSIFDNLGLPAGSNGFMGTNVGDMSDMAQFGFGAEGEAGLGVNGDICGNLDRYYTGMGGQGVSTNGENTTQGSQINIPQSDSSNGLTNYAFELLQKQSVWNLDEESLNFLQQQGQRW